VFGSICFSSPSVPLSFRYVCIHTIFIVLAAGIWCTRMATSRLCKQFAASPVAVDVRITRCCPACTDSSELFHQLRVAHTNALSLPWCCDCSCRDLSLVRPLHVIPRSKTHLTDRPSRFHSSLPSVTRSPSPPHHSFVREFGVTVAAFPESP
jgi:hypothetical protein